MRVLALILFLLSLQVSSQSLPFQQDNRQNPSHTQWREINTEHFQIIFPAFVESEARRVASLLETIYSADSESLEEKPSKLSLVLHPSFLDSNAFVTLAPRRSEWFLTPYMGPELGQTDWLSTLSVHEFRHVVQFEKSKKGFGRWLRYFLGQSGELLATGWSIPPWYMEGDAVGMETALSSGGRGRIPLFERDYRALLMSENFPRYDQIHLGSFKDYYPNHYVYGYFLTTYLRRHFGKKILNRIHEKAMKRGHNPFSFLNAVQHYTGIKFDKIFEDMQKELHQLWFEQESKILLIRSESLQTPEEKSWTNYHSVQPVNDNEYMTLRSGLSHIPQFVLIDRKGNEKVLRAPTNLMHPQNYKLRNHQLAFVEEELHSRWGMVNYNRIVILNLKNNDETTFQNRSRAFYPTLSHDSKKMAFAEWKDSQVSAWKVVDVETKKTLFTGDLPNGELIQSLDWIDDHHLVFLIRKNTYEQFIVKINIEDNKMEEIDFKQGESRAFITSDGTWVYYQSSRTGLDQIFRIHIITKEVQQLTSERFGAYEPTVLNNRLYFSKYTASGLKPGFTELKETQQFIATTGNTQYPYYQSLVEQEGKGDLFKNTSLLPVESQAYQSQKKLWNPHSWVILAPPLSSSMILEVQSTDLLNNLNMMAGAQYSLLERTVNGFALATYAHYYPLFSLQASYGGRRNTYEDLLGKEHEDRWDEGVTTYGAVIPYLKLWRAYKFQSTFGFYQSLIHTQGREDVKIGELQDSSLFSNRFEFNISFLRKKPYQDINSKFGIDSTNFAEKGISFHGEEARGEQIVSKNLWYLPSFFSHHSLFGEISYEKQQKFGYHYLSPIAYVRGYDPTTLDRTLKKSFNYVFPILYPEWSMDRYLYLKRISLNVFYDHAKIQKYGYDFNLESKGAELWFDVNILRNMIPLSFGLRFADPLGETEEWSLFLNAIGMTF